MISAKKFICSYLAYTTNYEMCYDFLFFWSIQGPSLFARTQGSPGGAREKAQCSRVSPPKWSLGEHKEGPI